MKIKKFYKKMNLYLDKKYEKIVSTFIGKVTIKLISEIVLACLIAAAVYGATTLYNQSRSVDVDNEKLGRIYVSVSDEYVESLFGIPYITITENESLKNHFYILNDAVLRTVSKNDNVVAYFITSTNKNRKIPVDSYETEKRIIGKTKYSDVSFANPTIESNTSLNGRYDYYSEIQGTGRYGMFNYYIYGLVPYGFFDEGSADLISLTAWDEDYSQEALQALRKKAFPNTFGVIAEGYEETISVIPTCDEWENMYYLLSKD